MRVLVVTNMYPTSEQPHFGVFVWDQVESLRQLGVEIDVLFVNGRRNKLAYLWGFPRLWNRLRRQRYDLLHAHYIFSGLIARAQLCRPVVLTHHGPEVFMTWEAHACRLATRWFDEVIVVSPEMRERLRVPRAKVIPCGIDLDRFRPMPQEEARRLAGLPSGKKLVLWAGEYQRPEKRFDIAERAFGILAAHDPSLELVLLSGKPHSLVPIYMNACDVLLLASDAEGSPMVVKEAMACNLPIVATPVGDVPQVIGGTEGCYLCSQDPDDVAGKLEQALASGQRTNGREAVRSMDLMEISKRVIAVYEEAVGSSRHAVSASARP
jgi:teichuronic acid biosynthesis glycosyltransferase TuaC